MHAHAVTRLAPATALLILALSATGCVNLFDCDTTELILQYSPSKEMIARAYSVDCGATTKVAIHVALYPPAAAKQSHDVFIYEGQSSDVRITWTGPHDLLIRYGVGKVYRNATSVSGVNIRYESL
jgi:hypothetical protein